jgi:hypothetical protein
MRADDLAAIAASFQVGRLWRSGHGRAYRTRGTFWQRLIATALTFSQKSAMFRTSK